MSVVVDVAWRATSVLVPVDSTLFVPVPLIRYAPVNRSPVSTRLYEAEPVSDCVNSALSL